MTKAEASQLVALAYGAYQSVIPRQQTVEIYEAMLLDLPFAKCRDAIIEHIKTSKWMPTIAEIRVLADPPPRQFAAPYHRLFDTSPEPKELPAKVVQLLRSATRALPPKPRGTSLSPDQAKALMLLEEAEESGDLTEADRELLESLKKASGL